MEKNIYYRLDYDRYESVEKWDDFCSTDCRFFVVCLRKGGFCSSTNRRELQPRPKNSNDSQLQESRVRYGDVNQTSTFKTEANLSREPLFWHFREGKGMLQPWRRKLWEHNK